MRYVVYFSEKINPSDVKIKEVNANTPDTAPVLVPRKHSFLQSVGSTLGKVNDSMAYVGGATMGALRYGKAVIDSGKNLARGENMWTPYKEAYQENRRLGRNADLGKAAVIVPLTVAALKAYPALLSVKALTWAPDGIKFLKDHFPTARDKAARSLVRGGSGSVDTGTSVVLNSQPVLPEPILQFEPSTAESGLKEPGSISFCQRSRLRH